MVLDLGGGDDIGRSPATAFSNVKDVDPDSGGPQGISMTVPTPQQQQQRINQQGEPARNAIKLIFMIQYMM